MITGNDQFELRSASARRHGHATGMHCIMPRRGGRTLSAFRKADPNIKKSESTGYVTDDAP